MPQLSDITVLRAQARELKKRNSLTEKRRVFEERKRAEWREIRENHDDAETAVQLEAIRQQTAKIMLELLNQGVSKTALGEAYGSKDRGTINELLDSAVLESEITSLTLVPTDLEGVGNGFRVDATNYDGWTGTVYVYADEDGDPTIYGEPDSSFMGTALHQEIAGGISGDFSAAWAEA